MGQWVRACIIAGGVRGTRWAVRRAAPARACMDSDPPAALTSDLSCWRTVDSARLLAMLSSEKDATGSFNTWYLGDFLFTLCDVMCASVM